MERDRMVVMVTKVRPKVQKMGAHDRAAYLAAQDAMEKGEGLKKSAVFLSAPSKAAKAEFLRAYL